jgi:hypothetical protein
MATLEEANGWRVANYGAKKIGIIAKGARGGSKVKNALLSGMLSSFTPSEKNDMKGQRGPRAEFCLRGGRLRFFTSKIQTRGKLYIGDYCKYPKLSRISKGY